MSPERERKETNEAVCLGEGTGECARKERSKEEEKQEGAMQRVDGHAGGPRLGGVCLQEVHVRYSYR